MKKIFIIGAVALMVACASEQKSEEHDHEHAKEQAAAAYTCPMHPDVKQDGPGKCPVCGMDLVPASKTTGGDHTLMLTDSQIKLANVTTQKVTLRSVGQTIAVNGKLTIDQEKTEVISSRGAGRIERLFARETGRTIRKGEPLYELYSETLLTLQREYLLAIEQNETLGKEEARYASYVKAAERKLLLYGLTKQQVENLAQTRKVENRITFLAPAGGMIAEVNVAEGQSINEGTLLFKIENISQLWVEAELYPNEVEWAQRGDQIQLRISGHETTPVEATINFLSPEYKAGSQITVVRANVPNPDLKFKPGMQTQITFTHSTHKALALPVDAVIRDQKGTHVYVQTDVNTFQPRIVKTGIEDFETVEITDGIMENEIVAVTGAYLLYSELILKKGADPMAGHHH